MEENLDSTMAELKRVNVLIDPEEHKILSEFQERKGYRTRDKAVGDIFREYRRLYEKYEARQ
jgi:hypothetical protein